MTLSEIARLVDAPGKWVLNTLAALAPDVRYTDALAKQLVVTRAVHLACGMPLADAFALAPRVLAAWGGNTAPVTVRVHPADDVELTIDVYRLLSSLHIRRASMAECGVARSRGRPRTRQVDPIAHAREWGLDLTLIRDNLRKTPAERVRQLDAMRAFALRARRVTTTISHE